MATVRDMTTYDAALEYLYGRINYERSAIPPYRVQNFKLERMRELMRRLGDPHTGLPIIHVAGTKGKGSTSSMLASMLKSAGYRTGLYTSPHLERTEERLVIDGEICLPDEFVRVLNIVRRAVDTIDAEGLRCEGPGTPTYFEVMTAMALVYFAERKVDVVVLEVGLGGRLDSTNIVQPAVTAITSISFDHTRQLGNTLASIAGEKAGIIKPGIPVVCGVTEPEPLEVIERVAQEVGAPLIRAGRDFDYSFESCDDAITADKLPRGRMRYRGQAGAQRCELSELELGLLGAHQSANAAVALAIVQQLRNQGWNLPDTAIRAGLANVRCAARTEVVKTHPTVVIDTAHNPASIAALVNLLKNGRGFARRHLIFACSKDKDPEAMLALLWPHFDSVVLTRFLNNPRAITPEELAETAARVAVPADGLQVRCTTAPDPLAAWQHVATSTGREDLVCITGSFFLAAELRSLLTQKE